MIEAPVMGGTERQDVFCLFGSSITSGLDVTPLCSPNLSADPARHLVEGKVGVTVFRGAIPVVVLAKSKSDSVPDALFYGANFCGRALVDVKRFASFVLSVMGVAASLRYGLPFAVFDDADDAKANLFTYDRSEFLTFPDLMVVACAEISGDYGLFAFFDDADSEFADRWSSRNERKTLLGLESVTIAVRGAWCTLDGRAASNDAFQEWTPRSFLFGCKAPVASDLNVMAKAETFGMNRSCAVLGRA